MNQISTKEQLLLYLEQAFDGNLDQITYGTTSQISESNHISRSLTSQYLNELHKEGKLVKVTARPVYYLHTAKLEEHFHAAIHDFEFYDLDELRSYLEKSNEVLHDFEHVIGSEGSLSYCITQMKSAMLYPPNGLPVVLQGSKGSGKAFLAEVMYEFCINQNLISHGANFIKEYVRDDMDDEELLFGSLQNDCVCEGLIEKAHHGLLYLADAQFLSTKTQKKLAEYIRTGKFKRKFEEGIKESKTRIVLGIENDVYQQLHDELRLHLPLVCKIPVLCARAQGEREEMIAAFLHKEVRLLHKDMRLSKALYQALIDYRYHDSIDEMYAVLRMLCANAYAQSGNDEYIIMRLRHLPLTVLQELDLYDHLPASEEFLNLDDLDMRQGKQQILNLYEQILEAHRNYQNGILQQREWLDRGLQAMRSYYDFIVFEQNDDMGAHVIEERMEAILSEVEKDYQITIPLNCGFILSRMVYAMYRAQSDVQRWEHRYESDIMQCRKTLEDKLPDVCLMAGTIIKRINRSMDVNLGVMNMVFLILNIHFYNRDVINHDTCGVIISHGYSTATSIADATNQMLQTQVFKAIDMPLDLDVCQIQKKLRRFIQIHPYYRNLIIMVDMGSLEDIAADLNVDVNIGVINNISTGLALDAGSRILQQQGLEEILQSVCRGFECHYHIVSRNVKEKAIVFTSDVGIRVAEKLVELFRNSLPKTIHLKFMEYDYARLQTMGNKDILFERYDVILLIRPGILKIDGVPGVSVEDLIGFKAVDIVNEILAEYLQESDIEYFNRQLLKNFSLHSIMENLTILNPGKLLDQVSEAITQLQQLMNRKFQSKTIIGIYMHTCFLIERLVTKTAIICDDMDVFEAQHQDFISHVHKSFERMLKNYSVELPVSEISYLYDYIHNEEWEEQ